MSWCFRPLADTPHLGVLDHDGTLAPAEFIAPKKVRNKRLAGIRADELKLLKRLQREARFRELFT